MDKQLIAERFSKAIATYPQEANVQRQIADKMIHLLTKHISFPCSKVIEFSFFHEDTGRLLIGVAAVFQLEFVCHFIKYKIMSY